MPFLHAQAEADATSVLESLKVYEPPVDPIQIASLLGVGVFLAELEPHIAGLLQKRRRREPEIYLNRFDHPNRQRFTCAHELGHFYQRGLASDVDDDWEFVDHRDDLASSGLDPNERYANGFAAALLMPRFLIEELPHLSIPVLAKTFQVSTSAMAYRLDNLGDARGR